jgi:hypothetical protein
MTPRTPQGKVFWAFLSNSKHSGVPEDSKSPTLGVLGSPPHFFKVGLRQLPWECECSLPHTPSHFLTLSGVCDVTFQDPLGPHPCNAFALIPRLPLGSHPCKPCALVASLRLGLRHTTYMVQVRFFIHCLFAPHFWVLVEGRVRPKHEGVPKIRSSKQR